MARDLSDLVKSLTSTAAALPEAHGRGVRKAATYSTTIIRMEILKITGDGRLSGVGKKGARVGASYKITGKGATTTAKIKGTGPLRLIEFDTRPHRIPRARSRRKKVVVIDGHPYHHANHPGTHGQHPFERGWRKAEPYVPKIMQDEVRMAVRKAW